jgi:hypothetical protein
MGHPPTMRAPPCRCACQVLAATAPSRPSTTAVQQAHWAGCYGSWTSCLQARRPPSCHPSPTSCGRLPPSCNHVGPAAGACLAVVMHHGAATVHKYQLPRVLHAPYAPDMKRTCGVTCRCLPTSLAAAWLAAMFAHPERPEYAQRILHAHLLVDAPLTAAVVGCGGGRRWCLGLETSAVMHT